MGELAEGVSNSKQGSMERKITEAIETRNNEEEGRRVDPGLYRYTPFENASEQIRILHIRDGWDYDMKCDLRIYDRDTAPAYQAISYTWGDPRPLMAVWVSDRRIWVRENCLYALTQVRRYNRGECNIWVDAICINQRNIEEKNRPSQDDGRHFQEC